MSRHWQPRNWEEACKRNAGRRKLHMRRRQQRANRILRLLARMENCATLRESSYRRLPEIAAFLEVSEATASRDLALCRRIHEQFLRVFGRSLNASADEIVWSWNWSHYGFRTTESERSGHKKPVGQFPFSTRHGTIDEDGYCGFSPLSWLDEIGERTFRYSGVDVLSMLRDY